MPSLQLREKHRGEGFRTAGKAWVGIDHAFEPKGAAREAKHSMIAIPFHFQRAVRTDDPR